MTYLEHNVDLVRSRLKLQGVNLIEPEDTFLLWIDFRELGLEPDALTSFSRKEAQWAVTRRHALSGEITDKHKYFILKSSVYRIMDNITRSSTNVPKSINQH